MIKRTPPKSSLPPPALGAYGAPPIDKPNAVVYAAQQMLSILDQRGTDEFDEDQLDVAHFELRKAVRHAGIQPDNKSTILSNTVGAVDGYLYLTESRLQEVAALERALEDQQMGPELEGLRRAVAAGQLREDTSVERDPRDALDLAIEALRQDPLHYGASLILEEAVALLREDEPVPIYGAPADSAYSDVVAMAYGVPPVYRPSERVKRWNRDHDHHPYRETRLVSRLDAQGLSADQIDAVLDVLDDICTCCWDAPARCRCRNDR